MESLILAIMRFAGVFVLYRLAIALYNISPFHPLYKFPGPRLASMTYAYEAYHDLWLDGMYTRKVKAIHDKYGELSQNDRKTRMMLTNYVRAHRENQSR